MSDQSCSQTSGHHSGVVIDTPVGIGAVSNIVFVSSGKGGVGKSTVAVGIALALWRAGHSVGLLDIDLCGPSVPRMLGTPHAKVTRCDDGWLPVFVPAHNHHGNLVNAVSNLDKDSGDIERRLVTTTDDIKDDREPMISSLSNNNGGYQQGEGRRPLAVMSIGFLLALETDAVVWRGAKKTSMVDSLLGQVHWGRLDWLVVDTPPGTSDEKITLATVIKTRYRDKFAGAVIVTTPQMVALADVRKEISFYGRVGLPVLGLLENMAGLRCPRCGQLDRVFSVGGGAALALARSVPFLGSLPLCPALARAADSSGGLSASSPTVTIADSNGTGVIAANDRELQTAMTPVINALASVASSRAR